MRIDKHHDMCSFKQIKFREGTVSEALNYFTTKRNNSKFQAILNETNHSKNDILISLTTHKPTLFRHDSTKIPTWIANILKRVEDFFESKELIFSKNGKDRKCPATEEFAMATLKELTTDDFIMSVEDYKKQQKGEEEIYNDNIMFMLRHPEIADKLFQLNR